VYQTVDFFLKTFVHLTPADAYEILRATSLNSLLRLVINWLKRETIISMLSLILNIFQLPFEEFYITYIDCIIDELKFSKSEKTGLVPVPTTLHNGIGANRSIFLKKPISQELKQIQLAIKSV